MNYSTHFSTRTADILTQRSNRRTVFGPILLCLTLLLSMAVNLPARAQAGITDLHNFVTPGNGSNPIGDVTLSHDGKTLYGMTPESGPYPNFGSGVLWQITPDGTYSVLHSFIGGSNDGSDPEGSLTLGSDGHTLYGMTVGGGTAGDGVIFSYDTTASAATAFVVLHSFTDFPQDGSNPHGNLTLSGDGHTFYGMTSLGGEYNLGLIFSFDTQGNKFTDLYDFSGSASDSSKPVASLTLSADGKTLYGMVPTGGASNDGLLFAFQPASTGGTFTGLHDFKAKDGVDPTGSVTLSSNGKLLYGMTSDEGIPPLDDDDQYAAGVLFSYDTTQSGAAAYTILHQFYGGRFDDGKAGANPYGSLTLSKDGRILCGMVSTAGLNGATEYPPGFIFDYDTTKSGSAAFTNLANFGYEGTTRGSVTLSPDGQALYGMTSYSGQYEAGFVFSLSLAAPVANPDTYTFAKNVPFNGYVLSNDTITGIAATSTLVTSPTHGTLNFNSGSFTYTPNTDFVGTDTFTYKDSNNFNQGNTTTVTLNVINATPPVAKNDACTILYNTARTNPAPGVLANDSDGGLGPLQAQLISSPTHGTLAFHNDGSFTYTPKSGYLGTDSFTYQAYNNSFHSNTATVTLTVVPVPPLARNDGLSIDYNTTRYCAAPGVLDNDDPRGSTPMTSVLVTSTSHGTLTFNAHGSFFYTPNAGYIGIDTFTYQAVNSAGKSNIATVTLTVLATPLAKNDACTILYNTPRFCPAPGVLGNDYSPPSGGAMTALLDTGPAHGGLTLNSDGSFTYTPNTGYLGTDTFTYHAVNSAGLSPMATVTLTVIATTPTARNDGATISHNTTRVFAAPGVLGNDNDGGSSPMTATLVTNVTNGTLTLNSDGSFSYTPNAGYSGTDTFTYRVSNPVGQGTVGTVTLTVQ